MNVTFIESNDIHENYIYISIKKIKNVLDFFQFFFCYIHRMNQIKYNKIKT